jgi:PAS domain S-box-containing protein
VFLVVDEDEAVSQCFRSLAANKGGENVTESTASEKGHHADTSIADGAIEGQSAGRKKAEAPQVELRESERRFREMIDALPAAIYTTDSHGCLTHFNPACVEFSGRAPQLGTDHWCVSWKMFRPDGTPLPHDECPMAVALKEGRIVDGTEAIAERPDGKRVWFTPFPRPLHDAQGNIDGGINMLVDITQRKEAEKAASLLASIVESSDDAIVSKNLDGVITSWNRGAERLFGYTAEEAIGQHITLIVPLDRKHEEATILERLKKGERVDHFETIRVAKDGKELDISLTISPVKDGLGRVMGASKVARDITGQKQIERELRERQAELHALAEGLEAQVRIRTQELEQRNTEVLQQSDQLRELSNRLLRSQDDERRRIARELHDSVGQMVTALGMNLSSIAAHVEANSEPSKAIQESRDLITQLNKEMRTLSYLLHPPLLDETGLSEAVRWYLQGLAERSELEIQFGISENFGRLSSDLELALFRIMQECLTNIHRHSESKTARVALSRTGETVSLEIEDEGKGISPEKLVKIRAQHSGVGITGMRERVRRLGGVLDIQSNGKGTNILVTFPVSVVSDPEEENA